MGESKLVKDRRCSNCKTTLRCNAAALKRHYLKCIKEVKK